MAWISPQVRSFNNQSVPQSTADNVAPSTGEAFWSQAGDTMRTISDFEQRAVDSNWLAPIGYYGQPSKEISSEEANTLAGRHIADKPIPQSVALDLANHEQDKAQREDVWNRYTSQHNALTNFGVGAAAFVADPVNFAAGFIPGPGEDLILGKLGYSATKTAPWLAKFGARVASGAIGGAAVGAPVSAAKYAASLDTQDYSMRQALLDTAAFAAYGALFHTGIHTAGDMFFKKSKAREDAMKSAVAQVLKGEPVNIEPVMNQFGIKSPNYEDLVGGPIAQDVSKKLSLAGRPQEEADAAGAIHQAIFNTASARFEGRLGTPEEMYKKYGSDIASGEGREALPEELNQYAGLGAFKGPEGEYILQQHSKAKTMLNAGMDPQSVRLATGWFRNERDGKWRYEISDANSDLLPAWGALQESKGFSEHHSGKMGDILWHPELYRRYPEAADINVTKKSAFLDLFQGVQGWFSHESNLINVAPHAKEPLSVMLHEIQHWIQKKEGFARGGNSKTVFENLSPEKLNTLFEEAFAKTKDLKDKINNQINILSQIKDDPDYVRVHEINQKADTAWREFSKDNSEVSRQNWLSLHRLAAKLREELQEKYDIPDTATNDISWAIRNPNRSLSDVIPDLMNNLIKLEDQQRKLQDGDKTALSEQLGQERAHRLYHNIAGEIEARDVQARQIMTDRQRQDTEPYSSQVITPEDVTLTYYDDEAKAEHQEYNQDAPKKVFYSALSKGVEGIKNEKAPADQWLQTIRNLKGVKKEEVDWSGVEDWLKEQKGSVTKAELQKFLEENAINVQEVEHRNPRQLKDLSLEEKKNYLAAQWHGKTFDELPRDLQDNVNKGIEGDWFDGDLGEDPEYESTRPPKYSQYVLPGGKDYRELLLTYPLDPIDNSKYKLPPEELQEYRSLMDKVDNGTATRQERDRYHELVLKDESLETQRSYVVDQQREFLTPHWDESNVLAHIRFDTRTGADGEKILHMAEVQSDWHQKGRREGYQTQLTKEDRTRFKEIHTQLNELMSEMARMSSDDPEYVNFRKERDKLQREADALGLKEAAGVLDAPFKQSWHELALKRMLRYAAEHGYDKLSWDTGEVTADRFDLSHQVSRIRYLFDQRKPEHSVVQIFDLSGHKIPGVPENIHPEKLDEFVGKEAADKIKERINNSKPAGYTLKYDKSLDHWAVSVPDDPYFREFSSKFFSTEEQAKQYITDHPLKHSPIVLEGLDLKIGGEGMKGFYDKILVDFMKKYTKKWGGRVEDTYLTVDEKLKKAFETQMSLEGRTAAEQESLLNESKNLEKSVHSVTITPEMKKSVLEGQPLFQARKGSFTMFPDETKLIKMFQTGDASTIIHETSHQLLENMREWANHPEAPESLREDWAAVKDWLGIDENAGITRTQHEKFARAGERYLKSGDAPSSALKRTFDSFKQWLTQIYRSVAGMQVPLKPEIKDIFDRLLATDQEILDKDKVVSDYAQERQGIADTGVAGGISQGRLTQAIKEIYPETETPEKKLDETYKEIEAKLQGVYLEDHLDENQQKQLLELNQLLENPVEYDQKMVEGLKRNRLDLLRSALLSKKIHDIVELNGGVKNAHTVLHSMMVGSHAPVKDATGADISRLGSENLGRAQTGKLISTLYSQLNKKGLLNVAKSGHLEKEVVEALAQLSDPNYKPSIPVSQPAKELAALYRGPINFITRKLNEEGGAQIGTALDYVAHTEYSRQKIRRMAGYFKSPIQAFNAYWEFFSQHLDHEKTFEGLTPVAGQSVEQAKYSMMRGAYDGILTGVHKKFNSIFGLKPGQYIPPQFEGTKNLARTMSKGRIFVLKNPQSFLAVMQRLGNSPSLLDNIVNHLERASKEWGLMKNWGTNPQGKLNWMIDSIERKYRDIDPDGVRKFRSKADTLRTTMKYLDGTNNTPKNERAAELARWGSTVRTLESSFMLGGVGVTHGAGAMITVPAELEHHGVMQIESLGKTAQAILSTKGMLEKEETAGGLTAFSEAGLRNLKSRFDIENVEDFPGGVSSYANAYMKLTALPAILNRVQAQIEYVLSERLGRHIDKPWEDVIQSNRVLPKYGITEADWKLLQSAKDSFDTDGSLRYLTANVVDKIPDEDVAKLLKESGSYKPLSKEIERYRWELSDKLITYFNDAAVHGIVTPGAYEKALAFGDNPRGSLNGEIRRFIMQFKMWPFALVYQNLMRTYMLKTSVAQFATSIGMTLGLTYIFGYARMAINDELLGREPRNPTDYRTILAALAQGGGLGIFGDYLFGQFNRFETNPWESTLGPVITDAGQLGMIYQNWTHDMSKEDGDPIKATDKAGVDLLRWGTRHIPFANLIYIKGAMDYMLMYHLYEAMSPGWWERTNRKMEKEQGRHMVGYHPYQGVPYGVPGVTLTQ